MRLAREMGHAAGLAGEASNTWAYERWEALTAGHTLAIERAREDYAQHRASPGVVS